jgi:hypothetical protein
MVFASIGGLIGPRCWWGMLAAYAFGRDDGYFNSDRKQLRSPTYAITTQNIDLAATSSTGPRTRSSARFAQVEGTSRCSSASAPTPRRSLPR